MTSGVPSSERSVSLDSDDLDVLQTAIKARWSAAPGPKARPYVNRFFAAERRGARITAKVHGNHGTYTVSIQAGEHEITGTCSCYIGKHGYCHHCEALGLTFLNDSSTFTEVIQKPLEEGRNLTDIGLYLEGVTLDSLLSELKAKGMTQKEFAESIGMNTRHLSAIKSSERRNRYFNELGATKLACLWVLEHLAGR
jgi:hypothetical protein